MKKTFIILIFLLSLFSCLEKKEEQNDEFEIAEFKNERFDPIAYVSNPDKTDSLCISEINKAKSDIEKEGIAFTQIIRFLSGHYRYDKELKELCKQKGLVHKIDLMGCSIRRSCYGAYMDKVLIEKFGSDFKENMHKKADSLFLQNVIKNKITVQYWDCDERPRLPSEKERTSDYIPYLQVENVKIKQGNAQYNDWPFFDLGFTVEKDSTISGFYSRNYVSNFKENEVIEKKLFEIAVKHIKKNYPIWVPGTIKGIQVKTDNNVRMHFTN